MYARLRAAAHGPGTWYLVHLSLEAAPVQACGGDEHTHYEQDNHERGALRVAGIWRSLPGSARAARTGIARTGLVRVGIVLVGLILFLVLVGYLEVRETLV